MAKLYGDISSDIGRVPVTRRGTKRIRSHTRSWDHGIEVTYIQESDGLTLVQVFTTGGSKDPARRELMFETTIKAD